MKKIDAKILSQIEGGNTLDWVCGGVDAGTLTIEVAARLLVSRGIQLSIGPIGWAVAGACTVYGVGRLADWW
jgi:hypothetical protein